MNLLTLNVLNTSYVPLMPEREKQDIHFTVLVIRPILLMLERLSLIGEKLEKLEKNPEKNHVLNF